MDTSSSTVCSDGASTTDIILPNIGYTSGNYNVGFDSYLLNNGGGLKLSDVVGDSSVTLSNGSTIDGGVFATFNEAAIYVKGSGAGTIDVTLQDSSSVHSAGNGIQVSSYNFSSASDATVSSRNYWGIWGNSSRDISIVAGGDVTGTQGIVATDSSGVTQVTTAADTQITGTSGAGLMANGGSVMVDAYSDTTGTELDLYSVAFNGPSTINTFGNIFSSTGYGILASSNSFSDADNLQIIASSDVSGQLDGIRGYTLFSGDVIISANANVKGVEGNGITGLNYNSGNIDVLTGVNAVIEAGQFGIQVNANGGYANIVNNGIVRGNSAVFAQSMTNIFIENRGIIENTSLATSDLAISASGSSTFLSNAVSGVIVGRIETVDAIAHDDIFNNFWPLAHKRLESLLWWQGYSWQRRNNSIWQYRSCRRNSRIFGTRTISKFWIVIWHGSSFG